MFDVSKTTAAARACLGTPFVAQAACPVQVWTAAELVVTALRGGGLTVADADAYSFPPAPDMLMRLLADNNFVPTTEIAAGTLLLFRFQGRAQHLAIATSAATMIHAFAPAGKVVETGIGAAWLPRLLGIYRHQG